MIHFTIAQVQNQLSLKKTVSPIILCSNDVLELKISKTVEKIMDNMFTDSADFGLRLAKYKYRIINGQLMY